MATREKHLVAWAPIAGADIPTPPCEERAWTEIILPTVRAMAEAGTPFKGVMLYARADDRRQGPKDLE